MISNSTDPPNLFDPMIFLERGIKDGSIDTKFITEIACFNIFENTRFQHGVIRVKIPNINFPFPSRAEKG